MIWLRNAIVTIVCHTVGCSSIFASRFEWPYSRICNPLVLSGFEPMRDVEP